MTASDLGLTKIIISFDQQQYEGLQWGRPGPGGVYWRQSALTGQRFFDNMVGGLLNSEAFFLEKTFKIYKSMAF